MVNSGSFDAAGSEGESAKAEFTQLEDGDADAAPRTAASPRHLTDFAAVVPDTNQPSPSAASERDDGLTTPPQATMTTLNTTTCPPATPTKASLQCSVPLDKVKNVLEMCRQSQSQSQLQTSPDNNKSKFNNYFILENYLKQKQKTNELTTTALTTSTTTTTISTSPSTDKTDTESTTSSSNNGESSKPTLKRLLCLFCDRTFTSNNLKQKHVDRCHSAGQTRRSSSRTSSQNPSATACCFCSKLNQTEHTLKELLEHLINEHSNRYYACLSCQERFTSLQSLRDHNKVVHGIEDPAVSDSKTSSLSSDAAASEISDSSNSADVVKRTKSDVAKSEAQTKSSPTTAASGKPLKRNSSLKINENSDTKGEQQRESSKSVGFHVDFEDSILANIINPDDIKKSKENDDDDTSDTISTRKSRSNASNSKNKQTPSASISSSSTGSSASSSTSNQASSRKNSNVNNNKKISVKSTKNGVRTLRTTRASVKQLNNFNKTRKSKIKSDSEPVQPEPKQQKSMCNPASVFSLVNAYIYKYEKIYDHASDSIKDANSVQFNAVFDREFYLRTVCNIRENLLNHLDGKLNRNIESETRISHFEHNPALAEAKSAKDTDNFGCDLSLNAVTPVATLLASSQYGEDFDAQIEYGAKASQKKPKKVAVVKYKFPNKKYNSLFRERDGHTDLTCLDMWTQLTVKNRQSKVHDDGSFDSDSPFFDRSSGFEAKHLVDELNCILDKRGPFEDLLMEANAAQFLELRKKSSKDGDNISEEASKDVYFILDEILNRVVSQCNETDVKIECQENETETLDRVEEDNLEIPHYFQLQRSPNGNSIKIDKTDTIAQICSSKDENDKSDKRLELTGEWTRPRIYICAACGLKLPNLKSLDDHKNNDHPHIWCSHYEFVGNQSQIYRHLSIPGLGKVGVIESQPQTRVWQRSDARVCSKCTKQCHNLGELHKHILECGGDWTWMLARKKCKYRPYGARTRRRRQRGYKRTCNPEVSRARELKPKNKPSFIGPRPKPSKPSDAETIERMLANLPPKRNRKMISMRDGIQRPRKPYKQSPNTSSSHLNISQKPPSKHFKNNSPQITKQTLRSALKRKLAMNNLRKQKGSDSQENVSLKLRSRMKNDERDETKNKDTEPLSAKSKLRNKRMISRILGSKIFDSNTAIVTRRRLVKAITQNNLMRKTRLRTKMLEANALKLEAQAQKDEPIVETETSTKVSAKSKAQQESPKESKRKIVEENTSKAVKSESSTKAVKTDKPNLENSTIDKPVKKSASKRFLSVLTKSSKKSKVVVEDTVSAVINEVVNMAHREENTLEKSESLEKLVEGGKVGLRRTRSSNKLDITSGEDTKTESTVKEDVIPAPETKNDKPVDNKADHFGKAFGRKTSKLMQNVKSFRKNIKQINENKTDSKNESIASKLIRTFSIRGSKRKKTNKTDETDQKSSVISFEQASTISEEPPKDEFKKTTIDDPPSIIDETEKTRILESTETSKTIESEMPILETKNALAETQICDSIVLPVESSAAPEQETCDNEIKTDAADADNKETDFKQSDEKLNVTSSTSNKFKSKMKRSGRGLNDCIAMLKCKLEQKTVDPPLVDKSNLFILNSLELNKHSLVSESSQINAEESTKPVSNDEEEEPIRKTPILENCNSQDAIDLSMVSKTDTPTLKNILEVPMLKNDNNKLNSMQKKEQIVEVSTVEIQTQTFEEDIVPTLPEYLPHIQSNIQLSSLLNATLKNCLMECVKNKCEELKNDTHIVRKSSTKDRKIGSVRKRRTTKPKPSEAVEKPPLNIPLLLNTAFTEKSLVKSKLSSTNSPRTTTAEDTSEDDLPLSKLVSSSSVESKLKVKLSVAKKKRSAKKQIAFTPLILNSPDTCIPQISFQERLEQRISLEKPATVKSEAATSIKEEDKTKSEAIKIEDSKKQIESNVPNYEENNSLVEEITAEANLPKEDLVRPIEENFSSTKEQPTKSSIPETTLTNNQMQTETSSSHPPLTEQVMSVEDEPLINYLMNKTLTETNVKPASSVKNAIPTENIELINNKLDCIDSGKENSDIQGIKKQKKTVKKSRGKRKSRGKLNATDSQIDYSTLEATEKPKTSIEPTIATTNEDVKEESKSAELKDKEDFNETNLSVAETKETDTPLKQSEKSNEDSKKKLKSPKKTADMASIIEAIEAAILSSIKIQDEIDNQHKTTGETFLDSSGDQKKKSTSIRSEETNLSDESNLAKEEITETIDSVVQRRRSRAKSKVNSESVSATPEESTNIDENKEKAVVDEIPVVKKRRGRAKKVVEEIKVTNAENITSLENPNKSLLNEEQFEIKRTTRAKPKVNYVETDILDAEVESMSEESNDPTKILDDNELKTDDSKTMLNEDYEKKRVTRGRKISYFETEAEIQSDSEANACVDKTEKPELLAESSHEAQVIAEVTEKENYESEPFVVPEKQEEQLITNNDEDLIRNDAKTISKMNNDDNQLLETVNQSKLETGVAEKNQSEVTNIVQEIPVKVKSKRGRKPKNKNKIKKKETEPIVTVLETGQEPNKNEVNLLLGSELTKPTPASDILLQVVDASTINDDTSKSNSVAQQILEEEKLINVETPIEIKRRRSCMKTKFTYQEADYIESDDLSSLNISLDSTNKEVTPLEEMNAKQESHSKESSITSETERIPELNANSVTMAQDNKEESFLHPEEIKPKRRSRTKIVSPVPETQNNNISNLEMTSAVSSDDSSNTLEESKLKRKSRTRKMLPKPDVESNSDLDVTSSINSNESFINPDEIKIKRRSRGKGTSSLEIDNESVSSLNSDESSINPEEIISKGKSFSSSIVYDQEPDIPESKSIMETAFSVFNAESLLPEINIESNTDPETVSSNVSVEDKKIKCRSRKKPSIDNIVSRLTGTVKHDEPSINTEVKQNSQSKITITIPLKNVQSNLDAETVPQVDSEDTVEKQQPPLMITIANQKKENDYLNQTNCEVDSLQLGAKPKRKSKTKIDKVEHMAMADILPKESNFNFNLSFENIKNKLKSRLEIAQETENATVEDAPLLTENMSTSSDNIKNKRRSNSDLSNSLSESAFNEDISKSEENQIRRTPKLKITLGNPETETVEGESSASSVENVSEITENKEKKKRRSFIKIKLNLPAEPEIDDKPIPEVIENLAEPVINESMSSTETKKKKRYRKKELELLGATTIENHLPEYKIQNTEANSETLSDNTQNIEKPEAMLNGLESEENINVQIENVPKLSEEIPLIKPEPKKRGRKPKNAKRNAMLDSSNPLSNAEISIPNLDTSSLEQFQLEAENNDLDKAENQLLEIDENATELEKFIIESERKSRRSRPKINYQEIENYESTDLSSDSDIKENIQDEQTEGLPEESVKSNTLVDALDNAEEKTINFGSEVDNILDDNNSVNVEQLHEDDQVQNVTISESAEDIVNEIKTKKKRGRKKAPTNIEGNKEEVDIGVFEQQSDIQIPTTTQNTVTAKPRGRGRPSTKQKQETQSLNSIVENVVTSTPDLDEFNVVTTSEISEESKRKSRCKISYQELENSTSVDSISDIDIRSTEEIDPQPLVMNANEIVITPHIPKKRGRKPKRKNLSRHGTHTPIVLEPVTSLENAIEEPISEEIENSKKRSRSNSIAEEAPPQITELKKAQEEQLPILKIDMKKRRQQTMENQSESEANLDDEFNETVLFDDVPVHKMKKKRRSRSKNSEIMSQQNIASAIELLTNVENTIESLKEFTKDKPLTNNFKNQLQENIEYEPESIMECKQIQELTSVPSLNVTVAISPAAVASDSEDELPLSILIKNKPEEELIASIPEINTVNESSLISENSLLDISVDEINFTKAENKLILSTHNSFDFDDDNIIDQEELSQLVDITSETLLENIENDYISTIDTVAAKEMVADKILDEIKQDGNDLDEIIEDLEIVTKLKADSNIVPPESLATIDKSAEELLNLIDAGEGEESDFIKTPDLKDTSLIIKIKKNFNVHIRKAKKGRRRVIPKSLNRNNVRRKEEEDAVCEICNKSFKRKETLASHKKTLTHIAKLSEIEARETQAKRLSESENKIDVESPEIIKHSKAMHEILNADESSCENVDLINAEEEKTDVPEIVNVAPQKPMNNVLPGLIVNSTNSNLKLIDIINEVLDKPVSEKCVYSPRSIRKSPSSCDSTETFSEPKRYKSLGERKSFDSDSYTMTPPKSNEDAATITSKITNGDILCKQLSILENIIEETNPSLNNYIDDSVSLSSSQFEEPLPEPTISDKHIDYTKFSHTADVLSTLIKPNHFNNFENISESFTKPVKHQEAPEHSHQLDEEEEIKKKEVKDNSTRKILNRDEELFLECCSLLKSGSEISGSKKSTKQIQLNNFSRSNDASWILQKQQNSDRFIQRDSYSWLAQSSRVETPIGEPFVNNDWSNSNSAVSSEWLAQKAPSPDRPTESNTILKKSNNNSEESKYTELRFEDISIDSSLETSKTLMAVEHSNTENIPLDFHNVDFANSNLHQTEAEELGEASHKQNEDTSSTEEFDPELKQKVVSAFGGLMAKALTNRLHAVVKKTKNPKGSLPVQSSITDYAIPVKKNKPSHQSDSDSSDCPKKLITKGAMKVFEGIKVSIPTQDLNLKEVLSKTKKPEGEATAAAKLAEKEFEAISEKEELANKNGKVKQLFSRFGNKLGLREKKKKTLKRRSPKSQNTITKSVDDVYEFEESQDKSTFSLFKHAKENSVEHTTAASKNEVAEENEDWNAESESDTDRYYDSMSFEEQSLSSESTPESTTTPIKVKPVVKRATEKSKDNQKKCMIMGRIFKNASKPKLEDKIPEIRDFTSEENSKVVENYLDSCSSADNLENGLAEKEKQPPPPEVPNVPNSSAVANSANKMTKKEMDMLFDKLLEEEMKMHEKEKLLVDSKSEKEDVFSKPLAIDKSHGEKKKSKDINTNNRTKVVSKPKKRQRHNSDSTSSDEFRLGGRQSKSTKKPKTHRKPAKPKKESGINLEQEMKECIGVAGRKSQRKCTSGKQNVLVEFWSSDESSFEEVLSLIEKQNESKPIASEENKNEIPVAEEDDEEVVHINEVSLNNSSVNNPIIDSKEEIKKATLDIYDFDSDAESKIEEFHPKPKPEESPPLEHDDDDDEFLAVNKMKIPKRIPKPKRNRKHSKNDDDESASEYEAEKTRRRNEHRRKKMLLDAAVRQGEEVGESAGVDCLAVSRRKRNAGDQLYYWSSSSDDEMQDLIEVKPIREDTDDDRPMHHGWIVGDSPKKLVTMLAQAKGKKIDGESVKEQGKKNRVTL